MTDRTVSSCLAGGVNWASARSLTRTIVSNSVRTPVYSYKSSGVTSHRQLRQCRWARGPKTVKGAQSDPNYVSRLLLDCVPVFHRIITPAYLGLLSTPERMFAGGGGKNYSYATVSKMYARVCRRISSDNWMNNRRRNQS